MSPRNAGFTLVELMITLAVLAVLVAIGFPSFQSSMRSNRVATSTNEMIASVSLARSEAVRNNRGSSMCGSASGTACDGTWNDGWIVWADANANGTVDAGETVLRYTQGNDKLQITGPVQFVHFDSRGRRASTEADAGQLVLQPKDCGGGAYRRTITIGPTGQVKRGAGLESCQ